MSEWLPFGLLDGIPVGDVGECGGIGDPGPACWLVIGTATDEQGGNVKIREYVYTNNREDCCEIALTQHVRNHGLVVFDNPIVPVLIWDTEKNTTIRKVSSKVDIILRDVSAPRITTLHANVRRRLVLSRVRRDIKTIKHEVTRAPVMPDTCEYTNGYLQAWEDLSRLIMPYLSSIEHELNKCPTEKE